ncbi:hypothetical protein RB653_003843 [Dictyostelium firmibasis]|uniref:RING-type domain-containing protein n=1 Tax=Dictyostelium firmibasis TaxID=79012 RepID=A0AAN7Z2V3_9MYCE
MGNTVKKASNINEFKQDVFKINSLINNRNKKVSDTNIYITLSIDIPDNDIVTETVLWKLLVNVSILIYNKKNDGDYKNEKPILKSKLTFGEFYSFLNNIQLYFENEDSNNKNPTTEEKFKIEEDDILCPICYDKEATLIVSSDCFHAFCPQCAEDWGSRSNLCPLCRRENNNSNKLDFILIDQDIKNEPILDFISNILVQIKK